MWVLHVMHIQHKWPAFNRSLQILATSRARLSTSQADPLQLYTAVNKSPSVTTLHDHAECSRGSHHDRKEVYPFFLLAQRRKNN